MNSKYDSLDVTGKVKVNAIILHAMANDSQFMSQMTELSKQSNSKKPEEGFQTVLDSLRGKIAANIGKYPDATLNNVDDNIDFDIQKSLLLKVKERFSSKKGRNEATSNDLQQIVQNGLNKKELHGRKYSMPMPQTSITLNVNELLSDNKSEVHTNPSELDKAKAEAIKIGKSCHEMGIIGAGVELLFGSDKFTAGPKKGEFKSIFNLNDMREGCFHELAAPVINNAGGNNNNIAEVEAGSGFKR